MEECLGESLEIICENLGVCLAPPDRDALNLGSRASRTKGYRQAVMVWGYARLVVMVVTPVASVRSLRLSVMGAMVGGSSLVGLAGVRGRTRMMRAMVRWRSNIVMRRWRWRSAVMVVRGRRRARGQGKGHADGSNEQQLSNHG